MDKYIKERNVFSKLAIFLTPADVIRARILLTQIPAEDVVEVVRCRYCQFYDADDHLCELYGDKHFDGFYCHDGRRRED